jgi:hypothetical protein
MIRNEALKSQTYIFQHMNPSTLWCELGFLFHMLLSVQQYFRREDVRMYAKAAAENEPPTAQDYRSASFSFCDGGYVDKVVQPGNFQRTFQLVPEAVAVGLFDSGYMTTPGTVASTSIAGGRSHSGSTLSDKETDILQTTQTFLRFILTQLNKELVEAENSNAASNRAKKVSSNVIDRVFGFYVKSCTTFLNSGVTETASNAIQSLSLELIYPSTNSSKPPHKQSTTAITMR